MNLVEAEAVGPIEGDEPRITPPRPPHRRVSVSLLFTLSVLVGLVVTIYTVLPARHDEIVTEAVRQHRAEEQTWDLEAPTAPELRAWAIGVVGKGVPLPNDGTQIVGARRIHVLKRSAALIRLQINGEPVTYLVQHARGIAPEHVERAEGELRAVAWRKGKYTFVAVGSQASARDWVAAIATR
jgi:hypothetical protein